MFRFQALAKQFADILHFTLKFDDLKVGIFLEVIPYHELRVCSLLTVFTVPVITSFNLDDEPINSE